MSGESGQPEHEAGEDEHGAVVVGPLLEAGGDAAPLLQAVDAPLDDVPARIAFAVEGERSAGAPGAALALVRAFPDGVRDATLAQQGPAARVAVPLVGDEVVRALARPSAAARSGHAERALPSQAR